MKSSKTTIGILIDRLNEGGAERSAGLLSIILTNLGYEVITIILFDDVVYPYTGKLINLGKYKYGSRSFLNKFFRYIKLKRAIKNSNCYLLLDFRMKNFLIREFFLNKLVFKTHMINMVRSFRIDWYLSGNKLFSNDLYKRYAGINTVSFKMQKLIEKKYGFNNVKTIHNPIDLQYIQERSKEDIFFKKKFVIAVGRLDPVKQFDKLIDAYLESSLPQKKIHLLIIGAGKEENKLKEKISVTNLSSKVKIIEFQENIFKFMSRSQFLVLASKNEGFPRVIIEALACETPVISFDCDSGPSEIINNEENGLLVENQDFKLLTKAMDKMANDKVLLEKCKKNALYSVEKFSMNSIGKQWDYYFKELNTFLTDK